MDCNWSQRVSQLIDGELSPEGAAETTTHLSACEHCRQAYDDFLQLQRELKSHDIRIDPFARERVLRRALPGRSQPFWKRKVAVPIPVMGLILIAIGALGLWTIFRRPPTAGLHTVKMIPADKEAGTFDLSRFDQGERAIIEKVKQTETSPGTMK